MRRAVFLDRDGVLNRGDIVGGRLYPPRSVAALELLPGVAEAAQKLKAAGYLLVIVTNQPDVAKGHTTRAVVDALNQAVARAIGADAVAVCYHVDADGCTCRKPQPGMIRDAAGRHDVDLSASFMVGDRWRDVEAGRAAGCTTILIGDGYGEAELRPADHVVVDLAGAADLILQKRTGGSGGASQTRSGPSQARPGPSENPASCAGRRATDPRIDDKTGAR